MKAMTWEALITLLIEGDDADWAQICRIMDEAQGAALIQQALGLDQIRLPPYGRRVFVYRDWPQPGPVRIIG